MWKSHHAHTFFVKSCSYRIIYKPKYTIHRTNVNKHNKHPKKVVSLYSSQDSKELYPGFTSSKVQSLQCHVAWGTRLLWSYPCPQNFLSRTPVANKGVKHKEPIKSPWKNMCKAPELHECNMGTSCPILGFWKCESVWKDMLSFF